MLTVGGLMVSPGPEHGSGDTVMFRRFLSLITFAGLLLLASGTNLFGQTRGCPPTTPRTLTPATEDPEQRLPAAQLMAHLGDGFQGTIFIPST